MLFSLILLSKLTHKLLYRCEYTLIIESYILSLMPIQVIIYCLYYEGRIDRSTSKSIRKHFIKDQRVHKLKIQ